MNPRIHGQEGTTQLITKGERGLDGRLYGPCGLVLEPLLTGDRRHVFVCGPECGLHVIDIGDAETAVWRHLASHNAEQPRDTPPADRAAIMRAAIERVDLLPDGELSVRFAPH